MNSTTLLHRHSSALHRIGIAWSVIWRALVAGLICGVGGILLGVTLGIIISFNEAILNMTSWREILVAYSSVFGTFLTDLPV